MSNRNPLEALEPRTLLSSTTFIPAPPPSTPGIFNVGRTIYMNGTGGNDSIEITAAPNDAKGKPQPTKVQLQVNTQTFVLESGRKDRFYINGGGGNDRIRLEPGLTVAFHPSLIVIHGGDGNDTITGGDFSERIFGDGGDDVIVGANRNDVIHGGAGNDNIDGGTGNDTIFGDDGNDTIIGGAGKDRLFGGTGDDTFFNSETAAGQTVARDLLDGGGGNDTAQVDPLDHYRLITRRF